MSDDNSARTPVNLLWTGGWDSTYQLLQLLLIQRCPVMPFYLVDEGRPSRTVEIQTMDRIKDRLFEEYPHTRDLLGPVQYGAMEEIGPDTEISEAYQAVLEKCSVGLQYEWLARFCKEQGIGDIQLCIHEDDRAHQALEGTVVKSRNDGQTVFQVSDEFKNTPEYQLYRYYSFPLFVTSKKDMAAFSGSHGWDDIMTMTWFCHTPTPDLKPCGTCAPCLFTIEEGLGWRVPLKGRIKSLPQRSQVQPLRSMVKSVMRKLSREASG